MKEQEIIEIIEEISKDAQIYDCLDYDEIDAIEGILDLYKRQKDRIKELEEEVERRIEKEALDYRYVDKNMMRKDIIQRDYIPKSKIKEKIEELKEGKDFDNDVYVEEYAVDILQELLEG